MVLLITNSMVFSCNLKKTYTPEFFKCCSDSCNGSFQKTSIPPPQRKLEVNPPTPFGCHNTLTIIRNNSVFPPPPDGRNFLCVVSVDLFWNDPIFKLICAFFPNCTLNHTTWEEENQGRKKFTWLFFFFPLCQNIFSYLSKFHITFTYFWYFQILYCICLLFEVISLHFCPNYVYNLPDLILTGGQLPPLHHSTFPPLLWLPILTRCRFRRSFWGGGEDTL